jgi:hypothetical protein
LQKPNAKTRPFIHLKAPLRHCSIIVSARRSKQTPLFSTAADGLEPYSRSQPVTPPDHFSSDIESWLLFRITSHTDERERFK